MKFKLFLGLSILLVTGCASFKEASKREYEPVSNFLQQEGAQQRVDVGSFTVDMPPGEGWEAQIEKRSGIVVFRNFKKKVLGKTPTVIWVLLEMQGPERWHQTEEDFVNDLWSLEEKEVIQRGEIIGYSIKDIKKDTVTINGKRLYTWSYKIEEHRAPLDDLTVQYLYFPQDFKETHIFYRFLVSEWFERVIPADTGLAISYPTDPAKINPVIRGFQIIDPQLAYQVGIDVLMIKEATSGNISAVRDLISKGANVNFVIRVRPSPFEGTALIHAVYNGDIKLVQFLLDNGADVNIADDKYGATALMYAVGGGHIEIVKLLIEKKADVNLKDKEGYTALYAAKVKGNSEIVRLLKEAGAKDY